jgi:hypothetical protein
LRSGPFATELATGKSGRGPLCLRSWKFMALELR